MSEIERGNPVIGDEPLYRFYKSNLPTVIWDQRKNRSLVEFKKGVFETRDIKIATKLLELGYPQISPLAESPPDIIVGIPGQSIDTSDTSKENIKPGLVENQNAKPLIPVRTRE